jgi:hypothetical protein
MISPFPSTERAFFEVLFSMFSEISKYTTSQIVIYAPYSHYKNDTMERPHAPHRMGNIY